MNLGSDTSGGDPLLLSPRRLKSIVAALSAIDHVGVIRIHTRIPVADPARDAHAGANALKARRPSCGAPL
jgi:lysine 2,3-aminomutase